MHENYQRQCSHQQIKAKLIVFSFTHLKNRYKEPADRSTNKQKIRNYTWMFCKYPILSIFISRSHFNNLVSHVRHIYPSEILTPPKRKSNDTNPFFFFIWTVT